MSTLALRIAISDLHVGARNSLFTGLDTDDNPDIAVDTFTNITFMRALHATLKHMELPEKPELILHGDLLDLSFASPYVTTSILRTFLGNILVHEDTRETVFGRVFYLPGNHDHEVWTADRFGRTPTPDIDLDNPKFWAHTTKAFAPPDDVGTTTLINEVIAELDLDLQVATYNPNFGWCSPDGTRAVVFHHGHYVESLYSLMTRFLELLSGHQDAAWTAEKLEQANGSWIDFGWSTLGDLGELGDDMASFMKLLATGGASHQLQNRISRMLAQKMQDMLPLPESQNISRGLDYISHAIVDSLLGRFSTLERFDYTRILSESSIEGLKRYLSETVRTQIEAELPDPKPEHLTFVFGHTHKPFEDQMVVPEYARPVTVYNTGGWVLDTALLSTVEGASAVFVDDDLNTAALRLFEMPLNRKTIVSDDGTVLPDESDVGQVSVVSADPTSDEDNPLFQSLTKAVTAAEAEWSKFSYVVAAGLLEKQQMFLRNAQRAEDDARSSGVLV